MNISKWCAGTLFVGLVACTTAVDPGSEEGPQAEVAMNVARLTIDGGGQAEIVIPEAAHPYARRIVERVMKSNMDVEKGRGKIELIVRLPNESLRAELHGGPPELEAARALLEDGIRNPGLFEAEAPAREPISSRVSPTSACSCCAVCHGPTECRWVFLERYNDWLILCTREYYCCCLACE